MSPIQYQSGHTVHPLIEAEETYAAIERAIAEAEREVFMAYWSLAPDLDLVTDRADDWEALLEGALQRGIRFNILLADFDPVFTFPMHRDAWRTFWRLSGLARAEGVKAGALQVICSQNPARPNLPERIMGNLAATGEIASIVDRLNDEYAAGNAAPEDILKTVPGMWRHLDIRDGRMVRRWFRPAELLPGSHHEKLCIVDRDVAFVGGLDIGERRFDTLDHDSDFPWHDLACRVEGPAVDLLTAHFIDRWNVELADFHRYLDRLPEHGPAIGFPRDHLHELEDAPRRGGPDMATWQGSGEVAVIASSARNEGPGGPAGDLDIGHLPDGVRDLILRAERFIYIETQFLREPLVADWLIRAAEQHPELEVIILVPRAPEILEPDGDWSIATKHGQWLQYRSIDRLKQALGARFGAYTLVSRQHEEPDDEPEHTALGAKGVYVHAKTIIVDDLHAMVGSANLNGRSFRLDTETAILWTQPDAVRHFRQRLWQLHLGTLLPDSHDPLETPSLPVWNRAAEANARARTEHRPGFAIPFRDEWASLNAVKSRLIRDRYV
ncbi:phospholipase D-like domain-containing protein [Minwuia sp.]|uniref:phospholipase D-like domain-containing protein n=1 Tax=Minwuia sp. TaxID=2493630 RepID=UPI003A912AD8